MVALNLKPKEKLLELVPWVVRTCRLTQSEAARLGNSLAGEIITATAYLSGCINPERIVVSHLLTLVAASADGLFAHQPQESLANRLNTINYFPGGSPEIIKAGMLLLELLSLNDHKTDIYQDIILGEQNPLIVDLDYKKEQNRIIGEFELMPSFVKEGFQELFTRVIKSSFWVV